MHAFWQFCSSATAPAGLKRKSSTPNCCSLTDDTHYREISSISDLLYFVTPGPKHLKVNDYLLLYMRLVRRLAPRCVHGLQQLLHALIYSNVVYSWEFRSHPGSDRTSCPTTSDTIFIFIHPSHHTTNINLLFLSPPAWLVVSALSSNESSTVHCDLYLMI